MVLGSMSWLLIMSEMTSTRVYRSSDICEEKSLFLLIAMPTGMGVLVFMVLTMGFEFCIDLCV